MHDVRDDISSHKSNARKNYNILNTSFDSNDRVTASCHHHLRGTNNNVSNMNVKISYYDDSRSINNNNNLTGDNLARTDHDVKINEKSRKDIQ